MKFLSLGTALAVAALDWTAHALPAVRPELPPIAFTDNGLAAFCGLGDAKPAWLHSAGWNMVRLVGRGENVRAGERFSARTTSSGLVFSLW